MYENSQKNILQEGFNLEKKLLNLMGLYPQKNKTTLWLRYFITLYISIQESATMYMKIFKEDDLMKITSTLYICITSSAYLYKSFNFIYNRNNMFIFEKMVNNEVFNGFTKAQQKFVETPIKNCKIIGTIYRITCGAVFILMIIGVCLQPKEGRQLPMQAWYPFDANNYFYTMSIFQILSLSTGALVNSSLDLILNKFVCISIGQFKVLCDNFKIEFKNDYLTDEQHVFVDKVLNKNIRHYDEIIKFTKLIDATFSNGVLAQFVASVIVICMTMFQFVMPSDAKANYLILGSYILCMILQITLYCWYGQEVLQESSNVLTACYMSDWYKYNIQAKKKLFIVMERAKKPVVLTAGKFFDLSLETLLLLFRSAMSYFAVLRQTLTNN